jgi:hypothetical protein
VPTVESVTYAGMLSVRVFVRLSVWCRLHSCGGCLFLSQLHLLKSRAAVGKMRSCLGHRSPHCLSWLLVHCVFTVPLPHISMHAGSGPYRGSSRWKSASRIQKPFWRRKKIKAHCENPFYSVNRMIFCHQKRGKQRVSF